ncbi:MAG: GNAT family N-acetyltransferase [Candidatus Thorarchaeota archaeon]|jgi:ribosomal protein S18 acetylase RimI-like enzyme
MESSISVRSFGDKDRQWARDLWMKSWNADNVVSMGHVHYLIDLKGFVAESNGERVGLLTYQVDDRQLEIVTLDSLMEGVGIGTELVDHTLVEAKKKKCNRVWLVTTNDNTDALRFYQRRGFVLQKINRGAIEESRRLKPSIPHVGNHGIPIRDEIVMEYML